MTEWRWASPMNRLPYAHWPCWVKIVHGCTFPVSETVLMGSMMIGTMLGLPMIYLAISRAERYRL